MVDTNQPSSSLIIHRFGELLSTVCPGFCQCSCAATRPVEEESAFSVGREGKRAFDELKVAVTTPPVLAMPNDTGEFILDTDASDTGIGAVLSQRQDGVERVVAYASRSLDRREQNYCVTRKELLAVVHFMKYFKQYLLGRVFRVRTDHAALTWLRRTPDPVGQQARWLEVMEEYDFSVEHRSGTKHSNADALSRRPCPKNDCFCHERTASAFGGPADRSMLELLAVAGVRVRRQDAENPALEQEPTSIDEGNTESQTESEAVETSQGHPTPWSLEGLCAAQRADPDIGFVIRLLEDSLEQPAWGTVSLQSSDVKTLYKLWPRLSLRDGLLKRRFESVDGTTCRWQIVWPKQLRTEFLKIAHSGMTGGHLGCKKTAAAVQSRAYWPPWSSDSSVFLKKCAECAQYHRGALPRRAELQTPLVGEPWEKVSVDITGPHPKSTRQNQYILTVVDHFSKWAEAIPIRNHTAPVVARSLLVHVFSRFGMPLQLLSDRGPEFESELFSQLLKWLEIDKLRTTAYKPSTNGVVERFHRTLNSMLGKVISESQRDWDERLPFVMAAYRASPHDSTGYSPNRLFLGRENRMPLDLVMGLPPEEVNGNPNIEDFVAKQQQMADSAYRVTREQLHVAAERRKTSYDAKIKSAHDGLAVGDYVWYYYPRRYSRRSPKWQRQYVGPYRVIRLIPPVNLVIQKSPRASAFVVHRDKLKKCYSAPLASDRSGKPDPVVPAETELASALSRPSSDAQPSDRRGRPIQLPARFRD